MKEKADDFKNSQVIEFLKNLDSRISKIEARLGMDIKANDDEIPLIDDKIKYSEPDIIESNLGEYWFANFGILILAVSVILLLTSKFNDLPAMVPSFIGLSITGFILYLSFMLRSSYKYVSNYLVGTGLVLLYFSILRLFHFGLNPISSDPVIESISLLFVVTICLIYSLRRTSQYLTSLSLTMLCATGIIIGNSYLIFSLITLTAALFTYFHIKNNWKYILLYGMMLCYFAHFVWAINNPFWANSIQILTEPKINLFFILAYAAIFAAGNLLNKNAAVENNITISNSIINAIGSFLLFQIICLSSIKDGIIYSELAFFTLFFAGSVLFWIKSRSKYSTSTYSLLAFVSLSITIIILNQVPDVFIFLIWQCIIVTITSLWFKSKTLTVTNFLIFLVLFLVYLFTTGEFTLISLSFGIVALISARILNWQKMRLTLKTEFMRNTYLAIAFFSIPFTLLKSLPDEYIALSWLAVSIVYYSLSVILKTFKYRWMGHLTLVGTILYSLIFGLASLDTTFRIVTLFAIGIVTILISILFTKHKSNNENNKLQVN